MQTIETLAGGLLRMPWTPGPLDGTREAVVVSITDFALDARDDFEEVLAAGLQLMAAWPVMHGAVGLWLWAKPAEGRSGSVSVWGRHEDLQRFVRWPTHVAIMRQWRERGTIASDLWTAQRFRPAETWSRAEQRLQRPHEAAA